MPLQAYGLISWTSLMHGVLFTAVEICDFSCGKCLTGNCPKLIDSGNFTANFAAAKFGLWSCDERSFKICVTTALSILCTEIFEYESHAASFIEELSSVDVI